MERGLFRHETNLKEFIFYAKQNNVLHVELLDFFWDQESPQEIRAYMDEIGVDCPIYSVTNNFLKEDSSPHAEVDKILAGIDLAPVLGAQYVRVFSARPNPSYNLDESMDIIVKCLKQCVAYAEKKGIKLMLENHGALAGSSRQALGILQAVGSDYFFINADTGNFFVACQDILEGVQNVYPKMASMHVKDVVYAEKGEPTIDGRFLKGVVTGKGMARIGEIMQFLKQSDYEGYITLEYEGLYGDYYCGTKESLDGLKALLMAAN